MVPDEIIKVLDNLCEKFGLAIDWSDQNILPYVQELIQRIANLQLTYGVIWLIVGIVSAILTVICAKSFESSFDEDEDREYMIFPTVALFTVSVVGFIVSFILIPKAIFLPELTALEYIGRLI